MIQYKLKSTSLFDRKFAKLTRKNTQLYLVIVNKIELISLNPFKYELHTHKVYSKLGSWHYSSRITDDLRVVWDFDKDRLFIELLDIGGHSGKNSVYK